MNPTGPGPERLVWIGLRRVHHGGIVNTAGHWLDHGRPVPSYLTGILDELSRAGLLTLADPTPVGDITRRAALTPAGHTRYAQLLAHHGDHNARAPRPGPDTESPTDTGRAPAEPEAQPTDTASGRLLPVPGRPHDLLCWAGDDQGQFHAFEPADALLAPTRGYTQTLCRQVRLPADTDFTLDPTGPRCLACSLATTAQRPDPGGWSL